MTNFKQLSKVIFKNKIIENKHYNSDNYTMYQMASCSKFFTALVVAILYEKGLLDYETDINTYLKSWKCPEKNITLKMLLTHTSGSGNHPGYFGYPPQTKINISNVDIINTNKYSIPFEITHQPETKFAYSGVGYQVIQLILEDITNKKLYELMEIYIFKPLNMNNSTGKLLYKNKHKYKLAHDNYNYRMYPDTASSGVWSCINDISILLKDLINGFNFNQSKILKQSTLELITSDQYPYWKRDQWKKFIFGLGMFIGKKYKKSYFAHSGNNVGYKIFFLCIPSNNYFKIVLSNHDQFIKTSYKDADKFFN